LNCSLSQACKNKRKAEKAGLLTTKKHFRLIQVLPAKDMFIRNHYYHLHPGLSNRLRFRSTTNTSTGEKRIELLQQLHDEIQPQITFSKRCGVKFTYQLYTRV